MPFAKDTACKKITMKSARALALRIFDSAMEKMRQKRTEEMAEAIAEEQEVGTANENHSEIKQALDKLGVYSNNKTNRCKQETNTLSIGDFEEVVDMFVMHSKLCEITHFVSEVQGSNVVTGVIVEADDGRKSFGQLSYQSVEGNLKTCIRSTAWYNTVQEVLQNKVQVYSMFLVNN